MEEEGLQNQLGISASIGFNKNYRDCMAIHPSDLHFLWGIGKTIVIKSVEKETNTYLKGHEGRISLISCSKSGNNFVSGEVMAPGF